MGRFLRRRIKDIRTIPPEILSLRISSNTNREIGLTQRQETFARYVAGGNMTYAEAAKLSGFKGKWVKRYGYMLMNPKLFPKVVERVREIKTELAYRTDVTFENHVSKMAEIRDAAMEKGNFTAAVAAEKSRGQAAGLYVSRSEIMVGKIDQMSREEVLAEIRRLQAEFPALALTDKSNVIEGVAVTVEPQQEAELVPTDDEMTVLNSDEVDLDDTEDAPDDRDEDVGLDQEGDQEGGRVDTDRGTGGVRRS